MARKYDLITELYQQTLKGITAPKEWQRFLATACYNFRLSFDEQVLLFAQRPDATAVLPIEGENGWNQRFGRWVNRGSTGIAFFDKEHTGRTRLKYYFDISDTHASRFARPVPIWSVQANHEQDIIESLANSFGELEESATFGTALLSAVKNAVEDNMPDYLSELHYYKENSFLEELDDLNIEVTFRHALQNSIGYMLLSRCGIDPRGYFTDDDFRCVLEFSTPETLNALGTATGDIGKMCLSIVSRTVLNLQKQTERQNRTFADMPEESYPVIENKQPERSIEYGEDHIHEAGRLQSAEPSAPAGAGNSPWEVRIDAPQISAAAPQSDVHESADQWQTERTSDGDRADSEIPSGADRQSDGEERGRDGGNESDPADEMGGTDEQYPSIGGRDDSAGADLQLNTEPEEADSQELPAFLNEKWIMAIIANKDDVLIYKKQQIEMFFSIHPDEAERAEYLKSAYQDRYTEIIADGVRLGYRPQGNGLLMWEGAYLSRKSESVFSWGLVAQWTAQLIEKKEYFINTVITPPKKADHQQMSLFDFAGFNNPAQEEQPQTSIFRSPGLSQQVIDEALCIGANDQNSRLIICAYFMKDKPLEDNAAFLAEHYGTNGAGFYLNERQYAIWYDGDGIRISGGESAQRSYATLISWEQAADRIRELLDMGRYMPQSELDRVTEYELYTLSDRLALTARDFSDEAKETGYAPTIQLALSAKGGFPEITRQVIALLKDPEMLRKVTDEWAEFVAAHEQNQELMRFRFYRPKELLQKLQDLQREPLTFTAAEDYDPKRRFFISADEIDKVLCGGKDNSDYRLGIYSFFSRNQDPKEREKHLKSLHGEYSGYHGGNDNRTYTGKGLSFSHGSITEPYAKVEMNWSRITKRITAMIDSGKFLSDADRAAMPDYEIRRLAREIHSFFFDTPDGYAKPFSQNPIGDYWEGVQEVAHQLTDPVRVEEIYQTMMLPLWESTSQDHRHYDSRKSGLAAMEAYRNGTYSVFGRAETLRPLTEPAHTEMPDANRALPTEQQQQDFREEVIRHLEASGYSVTEEVLTSGMADYGMGPAKGTANFIIAQQLIDEYCMEVFEQKADYTDLYHVDLAFSSTADSEHNVEIFADLMRYRLMYQVDSEVVHEVACDSMEHLHEYLANLDFDVMVAQADEAYRQKYSERDVLDDVDPAVIRERLAERGIVNGQVVDEDALNNDPFIRQVMADAEAAQEDSVAAKEEPPITQPAKLAAPKPKRERIIFTTLHPEIPRDQRHNFRITDNELGYGTPSEKYAANVAAIRCLKRIEDEERLATPEEQEILHRYIGWGSLADCFDERHSRYQELKSLLTEEEYAAARASSLTAFYTSPVIVSAMYQALAQMGFAGGNILEPACGVGNFIGMLPESMADSKAYGVEIDSISGRIAQQLYQNSSIAVNGFEQVQMPDSFFDVAIGNVPFGDFKVLDKKYDKHHWLIHDYFFGKTLDKVRPGGIIAFITSKGTMDKENSAVRKYLAQRADLIGAIRLPNNAFKRNAGTEVTSDILFLQKRDRMTDIEPDWVHLDTDENGIRMNSYFVQHPDMVLGEMIMESTRFGMDSTCKAYEDADLSEQLRDAISNLHA